MKGEENVSRGSFCQTVAEGPTKSRPDRNPFVVHVYL